MELVTPCQSSFTTQYVVVVVVVCMRILLLKCIHLLQENISGSLPNVHVFQPLDQPTATSVVALQDFSLSHFRTTIGSQVDERTISNAFWSAGNELNQLDKKKSKKNGAGLAVAKVVVMTTDDAPPGVDVEQAERRAEESIAVKGALLQLSPLFNPTDGTTFDLGRRSFWHRLLQAGVPRQPDSDALQAQRKLLMDTEEQIIGVSQLSSLARGRGRYKRAANRLKWTLGPEGPTIGIRMYQLIKSAWSGAEKGPIEYFHTSTLEQVVRVSGVVDEATGMLLSQGGAKGGEVDAGGNDDDAFVDVGIGIGGVLNRAWAETAIMGQQQWKEENFKKQVEGVVGNGDGAGTSAVAVGVGFGGSAHDKISHSQQQQLFLPRLYHPKESSASTKKLRLPRTYVTKSELNEIKYPVSKGLVLLGFKPLSSLMPWHQCRESTFCYPDEASIPGSVTCFAAMLQAMVAADVMAVCSMVRTPISTPRLVAVIPQEEQVDEMVGTQVVPPGMHLLYLPFADDIRAPERDVAWTGYLGDGSNADPDADVDVDVDETSREEAVQAMIDVIHRVNLGHDFDSAAVPNPHLNRWYEVLETVAIQRSIEELAKQAPDAVRGPTTLNADDAVQRLLGALGLESGDMVGGGGGGGRKRQRGGGGGSAIGDGDLQAQVEALNFGALIGTDTLHALTVEQLKKYCRLHGLVQSGNKATVIERIKNHYKSV